MRKVWLILAFAIVFMLLGFWCSKLYVDHIYSGPDDPLRYLNYVSLSLLFLPCVIFVAVAGYLSRKLPVVRAVVTGVATLLAAAASGKVISPIANVHGWTFALLLIPVICLLCGSLLILVGAIRFLAQRFRRPLDGT